MFLQPQLAGYVQDAHTPLHDTVVISFAEAGSSRAWRLSFMATDDRNHYRISADPLTVASTDLQDAGEYFQGWALTADSGQVMAMLRFRYAALGDAHVAERRAAVWPPSIRKLEIRFERADLVSGQARRIAYGEHGSARRTLRDIYDETVKTRAGISIEDDNAMPAHVVWSLADASSDPKRRSRLNPVTPVINQLWSDVPDAVFSEHVPDTPFAAILVKSAVPVSSSVARALAWMTLLFGLLLFLAVMFGFYIMRPVRRMARRARMLAARPLATDQELPYATYRTELGTLARSFNLVLRNARAEAERRLKERQERDEEQRRRLTEEVLAREKNLRMVGHEIRSPLQALLSFHPSGDPGRRYVERMIRALDYLYGSSSAEAAFTHATLQLERGDVSSFLREIAQNAPRAGIQDVQFEGPDDAIFAVFDSAALEDTIAHILNNADRYRQSGTPITIALSRQSSHPHATPRLDRICIEIVNYGSQIDPTMLERIFEYGVSDGTDKTSEGQGLFAAQNYARKMGGTIRARNLPTGVAIEIELSTPEVA